MNITAKYFWYCKACNCYEYDCRGTDGCITLELGYLSAHQRARVRKGLDIRVNENEQD